MNLNSPTLSRPLSTGAPAPASIKRSARRSDRAASRASTPAWTWRIAILLAACSLVIYVYVRLTSGKSSPQHDRWYTHTGFHSAQAKGFLSGHTYLPIEVPAKLLALRDPYDPRQNNGLRLGDAVLYQGRYYMYWGPVPALVLLPFQWAHGTKVLGDQYPTLAFTIGAFVFGALLLLAIWWRARGSIPWWLLVTGITAYGLSNPMPFLLSRPAVYEAAIAGGQCFLIGGLLFAVLADGVRRRWAGHFLWLLSGAFMAAAVGSRVSLAPAIGAFALLAGWRILRQASTNDSRSRWASVICLSFPLCAGATGLALFNKARFGSFTNFGVDYMLASINVHAVDSTYLTSLSYLPANLYSFLLRPILFTENYPFAIARVGLDPASFPSYVPVSPHYNGTEPVAGALLSNPLLWCLVLPLVGWIMGRARGAALHETSGARKSGNAHGACTVGSSNGSATDRSLRRGAQTHGASTVGVSGVNACAAPPWFRLSLLVVGLLGIVPTICFIGSTMRYLADGVPALTLLAIFEAWHLISRAGRTKQFVLSRWAKLGFAVLCTVTAVAGTALGESGYYERRALVIQVDRGHEPALGPGVVHSFSSAGEPVTLTVRCNDDADLVLSWIWRPQGGPGKDSSWSLVWPSGRVILMPTAAQQCTIRLPISRGDHEIHLVPTALIAPPQSNPSSADAPTLPATSGFEIERLVANMVISNADKD